MAKEVDLGNGKILPLVLKLCIPNVIAQLITFLYNVVDRIYVTHIPNRGTDALAALGIVLPITIIIQAFANFIGAGGAPRASMKLGEKKKEEANKIFNNAFVLLLMIGVVLTLVCSLLSKQIVVLFGCPDSCVDLASSYLRVYSLGTLFVLLSQGLNAFITAQGHSFFAMASILIGAIANVALDPLFIFVFQMGVVGASLATIISQALSMIFILCFFFSKRSVFSFKWKDMKLNATRVGSILSLGLTPFIMLLTETAIQIVFNINLNMSTNGNASYTAALTIMLSALQLISLPLNGLGYGIQPYVSFNYGKGDAYRLKKGVTYVTIIAFIYTLFAYTLSMTFPQIYSYMFSASDEVAQIVKEYTPFFLMGSIMFFVQMTLQNVNVALGRAKTALFLAVLRKVIILIPLCFLLTYFLGFKGVYLSEGIADLVAGIITSIVIFSTFPKVFMQREEEVKNSTLSEK